MTIEFPLSMETKRLLIKKYELSFDLAKEIYEIIDKNRSHLLPWMDWALPEVIKSPEDEYNYLINCEKAWKENERFEYGIFDKTNHSFLGGITLMKRGRSIDKSFEIGFWLIKEACGKGYMSEAVNHLEKTAFSLGVVRLTIKNNVKNIKSVNVAKNLGYILEGVERKSRWHEALNKYTDTNVFAKTRD